MENIGLWKKFIGKYNQILLTLLNFLNTQGLKKNRNKGVISEIFSKLIYGGRLFRA